MSRENERDYDEFQRLKGIACTQVDEVNAVKKLQEAKQQIMDVLKELDINNITITQVEDLYLIAAKLTQAASYVAAISKAQRKGNSFDEEIASIGTDDVMPILLNTFKNHPKANNLHKIILIDEKYQPAKEAWAAIHDKMGMLAKAVKIEVLKNTVSTYLAHLENKLKESGINIPPPDEIPAETPPLIIKLITRYASVLALGDRILSKDSLDLQDIKFAKDQIKICLENKPDWSERPFLQKFTDVLSLGLKPLYRSFFSKEKDLQMTVEQSVEPPKMGG